MSERGRVWVVAAVAKFPVFEPFLDMAGTAQVQDGSGVV